MRKIYKVMEEFQYFSSWVFVLFFTTFGTLGSTWFAATESNPFYLLIVFPCFALVFWAQYRIVTIREARQARFIKAFREGTLNPGYNVVNITSPKVHDA